jgi:prolyl-tRNA synthetase
MRTKLFLRTTEFLWQEGHTAHATAEEAEAEARQMLEVYADFAENVGAVPVIKGRKSESEKFAGAVRSYTIEAMMGDKRALQSGTSHFLGQNFAKAFDIKFLDQDNQLKHVWTTSWGLSTRFIGAVVMAHGDDQGLVLPPKLAPLPVVIVPIWRNPEQKAAVLENAHQLRAALAPRFTVKIDDRDGVTPGFKFNDWELRGVPVRLEIGPRDIAQQQVVVARRDTGEKLTVPQAGVLARVEDVMADIQANLFKRALAFREANTYHLTDYAEFTALFEGEQVPGFVLAYWCGNATCEEAIKADTKATSRCIPFEPDGSPGRCIYCGAEASEKTVFAKAY